MVGAAYPVRLPSSITLNGCDVSSPNGRGIYVDTGLYPPPNAPANLTVTNSIVVANEPVVLDPGDPSGTLIRTATITYSDLFTAGNQIATPPSWTLIQSNNINIEPEYFFPESCDPLGFEYPASSPLAVAGTGGTFLGSQGPTALGPEIDVTPLSLSFGIQQTDLGPTASQDVAISNLDPSYYLHFIGSQVALSGPDAGEFSIAGDTAQTYLPPSLTRTVMVSFDPSTTGLKSANLVITSNDQDEPTISVALSGEGAPPPTSTPLPTPTPTQTPVNHVNAPTGLHATGGVASILLNWNPNSEPNIAGYNVYRDTTSNGPFTNRLNGNPIEQPSFTDTTAAVGITYYYKVTAVPQVGLESSKSAAASASLGTILVTMRDVRGLPDTDVTLAINVPYATGITGNGMDIKVTYDTALLSPIEVQKTVLTQSFTFVDNISIANGQINISGISASGATITGEGHILDIVFHVAPSATNGATGLFAFVNVTMFDAVPNQLSINYSDTATFTVASNYILGDVDGNGSVNSGDALIAQQIATGERTPTPLELQAGDVNVDGVIDSADVTLILRLSVGLPTNPPAKKSVHPLLLSGGDKSLAYQLTIGTVLNASHGDNKTIPVSINTMQGVAGVDLIVNFDPSVLSFQSVTAGTLVQTGFLLNSVGSGGSVHITLSSAQASVNSGGVILNLNFVVLGYPGQESLLPPAYLKLSGIYGENKAWTDSVTAYPGLLDLQATSGFENDAWMLYQ